MLVIVDGFIIFFCIIKYSLNVIAFAFISISIGLIPFVR